MDASRLLKVLRDLEADLADPVLPAMQSLVQTVTTARDAPAQDYSLKLEQDIEAAKSAALAMYASAYPPSAHEILTVLDLSRLSGAGLAARIVECFEGTAMSPATAVRRLTELQSELTSTRKTAAQVAEGLQALGLEENTLEEDEYELGVLVPSVSLTTELGALNKELESWNKIVRAFQEAAGDAEREVQLRSLSNGSILVYLAVSAWVADKLMTVVERLLAAYERILDIRKKRKELADLGVPASELAVAKKTEKEILDAAIEDLVKETMKAASKHIEAGRTAEVEGHIRVSVRSMGRFLDRGGQVEVTAPDIEEPPSELVAVDGGATETRSNADIVKARKELEAAQKRFVEVRRIARRGALMATRAPIERGVLQLEAGSDGDDEKGAKKAKGSAPAP